MCLHMIAIWQFLPVCFDVAFVLWHFLVVNIVFGSVMMSGVCLCMCLCIQTSIYTYLYAHVYKGDMVWIDLHL